MDIKDTRMKDAEVRDADLKDRKRHVSAKETVRCDLCGSGKSSLLCKKQGFRIIQCDNCGLVYVNPRLKADVLAGMYNKGRVSPVMYYKQTLRDDRKTFRKRLRLLKRFVKKRDARVLDVGCNIGTFMLEMKRQEGWKPMGIDLNKGSIEHCRKMGLDARCSTFDDVKLPDSSFDLIVMNDFLEHVHSPTKALQKANQLLKRGGNLFITTPDIGSLVARLSGKRWVHLKPDEHIYFFSQKTIKKMLKKTGFSVRWLGHLGRYRSLRVVLIKTQSYCTWIWNVSRALGIDRLLRKVSLSVNPYDEMGLVAEKK
ncbi:methyltransferase domain-containing protein [Candidatus Woesearchaeota archaeon]|nr:methyltransferase domain-containing protein [Candidatus Woesearchaeota archaeon]